MQAGVVRVRLHGTGLAIGVMLLALLAALLTAAPAWADFHIVGEALNFDPTKYADEPSIASVGGVPYVAWREQASNGSSQVRVARLNGAVWEAVGGSLNFDSSKDATDPVIAGVAGAPYVAWSENNGTNNEIRVKSWNGSAWTDIGGGSPNVVPTHNAFNSEIVGMGNVPYVTWDESNGSNSQIFVKKVAAGVWQSVGSSPLNIDANRAAFRPTVMDLNVAPLQPPKPYVAWTELDLTGNQVVHVKRFDGSNWVLAEGGLLPAEGNLPRLAAVCCDLIKAVPFMVFDPDQDGLPHVARFDSAASQWVDASGALNATPGTGSLGSGIAAAGGTAWVTWSETPALVSGKVYAGWTHEGSRSVVGGPLNLDPNRSAGEPKIADADVPYVVWDEYDGANTKIHVAREALPICGGGSASTRHDVAASVVLSCSEAGGALRVIDAQPAHGTLSAVDQAAGTVAYTPSPGYVGPDSFTFHATVGGFDSGTATISVDVTASPAQTSTTTTTTSVASLTGVSQSRSVFAVGRASTPVTGTIAAKARPKPKRGTTWSFKLDQPATVKIAITYRAPGRKVGKACRKPSHTLRSKPRCTRTVTAGMLTRTARAGLNKVAFSGRIGRRALTPRRYTATFTAVNAAGRSWPTKLNFTIVAG